MTFSVCILTAGTGRRSGPFADIINKCLLPYRGRAIISHLIERFPANTHFVIALGYKGEQVRAYLTLMHPDRDFTFVPVDRFTGPGTGPGYSLSCCKSALPGPFYFIAGDGIFETIPADATRNWAGLAAPEGALENYCNIAHNAAGRATAIYDKAAPPAGVKAGIFTGLLFIKDTEPFWKSLFTSGAGAHGEKQISQGLAALVDAGALACVPVQWRDLGTFALYKAAHDEAFDFSKTEEFIYLSDRRVVKFFAHGKHARQRVAKAALAPGVFPRIAGAEGQFYAYDKIPGATAYERLTPALMAKLLPWLKEHLWKPHAASPETMHALCEEFYHVKTRQRVALYRKKYPDIADATMVNGEPVLPVESLLARLPAALTHGVPRFIHGDLQFDNIITDGERFTLIDWRQDFAGEVAFGDWYYDLAKLLGGIYLNYDYIKQGRMAFAEAGGDTRIDFATRPEAPEYAHMLEAFAAREGLDFTRVETLRGLIYLNMAPLHHPPFDRLLWALAQRTLTHALAEPAKTRALA